MMICVRLRTPRGKGYRDSPRDKLPGREQRGRELGWRKELKEVVWGGETGSEGCTVAVQRRPRPRPPALPELCWLP